MALRLTGGLISKTFTSNTFHPGFITSTINLQVRNAARKGYREKARKKLAAQKLSKQTKTEKQVLRVRQKFEKTVELAKPDPPNDDVFLASLFKHKKYSFQEAVKFHQEYHHPTVFNNPIAPINVRIEFNMIGKKKTQVMKPFRGLAAIPHPFNVKMRRELLVFCGPEYVEEAITSGATLAGGLEIIDKVKTGYIQPNLYDYILCHTLFLPSLTPIRGILKAQMPRPKAGTLTNDFKKAIPRFLHGIQYTCVKMNPSDDFGIIDCQVGTVEMKPEHVEENLKALLEDFQQFRPPREGSFVSWIWCRSPPSKEEFAIDLSPYEVASKKSDVDYDDEDEDGDKAGRMSRKSRADEINEEDEDNELEGKVVN